LTKNFVSGLFGQETLTKTLLQQKKPRIKQGLPVKTKHLLTAASISALLFSAVAGASFVDSTQANPYRHEYKTTEVPPPADAKPPVIIIHTPQNGSYYPKNLNLTFDVNIPETNFTQVIPLISKVYYKDSRAPTEISITDEALWRSTSFSIDLSDLPGGRGGNLSLTIYAVGSVTYQVSKKFVSQTILRNYEHFEITGYSTVHFTKDIVSPKISFLSPPNGTYVTSDVKLDFTVNEAASEILYCLDGKENQTITDSLTLTGLKEGAHNVTLYAADLAGNVAEPKTLLFNVDLPESFPVVQVATVPAIAIVLVGAGLIIYFKKRKH
jgi:hypothetical protein